MTAGLPLLAAAAHLLADVFLGLLILKAYRWVRLRSRLAAGLMAIGVMARASIGLTLFWISHLKLPVLEGLHSGGGFWFLAPDAGAYYSAASLAYVDGISAIPANAPSPGYVILLAEWMRLVGLSPASGFFLNLTIFAALCVLIVKAFSPAGNQQRDIACAVCLAPFAISPALLVHGSQPLKDEVFVFLIAAIGLCVWRLLAGPHPPWSSPDWRSRLAALCGLSAAASAMSGIRFYFVEMIGLCLALAILVDVWRTRRASPGRAAAIGLITLMTAAIGPAVVRVWDSPAVAWTEAARSTPADAGRPLAERPRNLSSTGLTWESPLAQIRTARAKFQRAIGESSFAPESATDEAILRPTAVGMALLFAPISIVTWLEWTDVGEGRGLLFVTDIDTVLLDLSMAACAVLLFVRREWIGQNVPYVVFILSLALMTTCLLAFVVTNFGTLFRLRLMMAAPLWMLPLAVTRR